MQIHREAAAHSQGAYTVIELVLCVLVTAVIAAIGVSAYQTYRVRSQIAASILLTESIRAGLAQAYYREQRTPDSSDAPGLLASAPAEIGRWIESLSVVDGRIDLVYGGEADAAIAGRRLSLMPYESATRDVVWICGNRIPSAGLRPLGFSLGGPQAAQIATTIEARYLPRNCR